MKYIITENKLRNFLKNKFNLDLTGNIELITNSNQLPSNYGMVHKTTLIKLLDSMGPMFRINFGYKSFLVQPRSEEWTVIDGDNGWTTEDKLFKYLGMPKIMSIGDIIDAFFDKTEDLNESVEPNYTNVLRKFIGSRNYKGVDKVEIEYDKDLKLYYIDVSFEDEFSYPKFVNDTLWDIEESIKDWLPDVKVSMYRKF